MVHEQAEAVQEAGHAGQLGGVGGGFVNGCDQPEAGQHGQQGGVRHGMAEVLRAGAGPEGVQWLDFGAHGQVAGGIPEHHHRERQSQRGRQAHGQIGRDQPSVGRVAQETGEQGVEQPRCHHAQGAQPEGQRATFGHQLALHVGHQPVDGAAGEHGVGDAEADGIIGTPRIAADQAGQHIDRTEQQRNPARQTGGVGRGDQIGSDAGSGAGA